MAKLYRKCAFFLTKRASLVRAPHLVLSQVFEKTVLPLPDKPGRVFQKQEAAKEASASLRLTARCTGPAHF